MIVFTAIGGAVTALACAQCFVALAGAWWQCGRAEEPALPALLPAHRRTTSTSSGGKQEV